MYTVVSKQQFSEKVFKLEITAPLIARSRKAGHFVIVRLGEKGERVPLTIAGADIEKGTITLVIQKVGHSSTQICDLNVGDQIADIVGPLGQATHIDNFGTVVCAVFNGVMVTEGHCLTANVLFKACSNFVVGIKHCAGKCVLMNHNVALGRDVFIHCFVHVKVIGCHVGNNAYIGAFTH